MSNFELFKNQGFLEFEVKQVRSTPPEHPDATLVWLIRSNEIVKWLKVTNTLPLAARQQRACEMELSQECKLFFSMHGDDPPDYTERLRFDRSPTDPNNSGGPVFSR